MLLLNLVNSPFFYPKVSAISTHRYETAYSNQFQIHIIMVNQNPISICFLTNYSSTGDEQQFQGLTVDEEPKATELKRSEGDEPIKVTLAKGCVARTFYSYDCRLVASTP